MLITFQKKRGRVLLKLIQVWIVLKKWRRVGFTDVYIAERHEKDSIPLVPLTYSVTTQSHPVLELNCSAPWIQFIFKLQIIDGSHQVRLFAKQQEKIINSFLLKGDEYYWVNCCSSATTNPTLSTTTTTKALWEKYATQKREQTEFYQSHLGVSSSEIYQQFELYRVKQLLSPDTRFASDPVVLQMMMMVEQEQEHSNVIVIDSSSGKMNHRQLKEEEEKTVVVTIDPRVVEQFCKHFQCTNDPKIHVVPSSSGEFVIGYAESIEKFYLVQVMAASEGKDL